MCQRFQSGRPSRQWQYRLPLSSRSPISKFLSADEMNGAATVLGAAVAGAVRLPEQELDSARLTRDSCSRSSISSPMRWAAARQSSRPGDS